MVKQVSHIAVIFLDQNSRATEKISRPRNRREEVLGLEWNLLAVKRDLLASKMSTKQLPRQVYTRPRSRRAVKMKTTEELAGDGEEHG